MTPSAERTSTFATRLTAIAPAAIAVIELSGPSAETWMQQCWRPASDLPRSIGAIRYGSWIGISNGDSTKHHVVHASEAVVICWTNPTTVEIHCHGGKQAAERILNDLQHQGAEVRSAHDRLLQQVRDPLIAAALIDLEKATTEICAAILLDQARGALSRAFQSIRQAIKAGDTREAILMILELLSRAHYGLHLIHPWQLSIIGPPNAGKSSLLNAILGYDRAIVDMVAGTTRDALCEQIALLGWPFLLVDTAGLRDTNDLIEHEGVNRAFKSIDSADVILLLIEPKQGWTSWHRQVFNMHPMKCIAVHTKTDLELAKPAIPENLPEVRTSGLQRTGLDHLYQTILTKLIGLPPQPNQAVPFRSEHVEQLRSWLDEIDGSGRP